MSCDVAEATEGLENELWRRWSRWMSGAHSPTFPSLHLRHNSFSNPSVASLTSHLILQPFRCFSYVIVHSPTLLSLLLRHRLFTYVTWRAAHTGTVPLLWQGLYLVSFLYHLTISPTELFWTILDSILVLFRGDRCQAVFVFFSLQPIAWEINWMVVHTLYVSLP